MRKNIEMPFESNPVPMLIYRSDNLQIEDVNPAALNMYGYTRKQMLQMAINDLRAKRDIPDLLKWLEQNPTHIHEVGIREHLTAEGELLYVRGFGQPLQEDEKKRLVLLHDVTSEVNTNWQNSLLSLVARNTNNGVVITDHNRKIDWVNEAWSRMTGYTLEEARGKKPGDLLQGTATNSETIAYMSRQLKKGEGFKTQILNYRKDGTTFWNNMEIQPVHDEEGSVIYWVGVKDDITDRINAQQQAKESKTLFYRALRLAPIPVMLREEDGTISFINKAFEEASGYKHEDIPNIDQWVQKAHPYSKKAALQSIEKVFEEQKVNYGGDHPVYTKNGERRIWEFWDAPLGYMSARDCYTAIAMALDVTELRNTQQELEQELTKFRQLFEHAPNALAMSDPDGNILEVNDEFERFFGYNKEEVADQNIDRLLTSNDSEFEYAQKKTQLLNQHDTFWEKTARFTKNGKKVPVYIGGIPVSIQGQVQYHFNIYSDISQINSLLQENQRLLKQEQSLRAKAEESRALFQDMFEEAPAGIALVEGPTHVYSYANSAYQQMMGWKHNIGKSLADISPEAKEQGYLDLLDRVYQSGQLYSAKEEYVKVYQENGDIRELYRNFTYKPLKDKQGETYGILIHAVDVTDQVKFRQQIEQQLEEKSMLLEEIHHRVKNNLAVITSLLYLQQEETSSSSVQESLQEAQNRIQSIALVHQQLYRQAESDASIEMDDYMASLLAWLRQSSEPPGTSLEVQSEANNIKVPLAEAVPVGMLATELITNACKHAFEGRKQGRIDVSLTKDHEYYYLKVSDDGKGLPEDFSMDTGHTGMNIIQSLLVQLKAEITSNSRPGQGTSFAIQIPISS